MLFIQKITVKYQKDVRFANYANQRHAIKFCPVDVSLKPDAGCEVFFTQNDFYQIPEKMLEYPQSCKLLGDRAFYNDRGLCDTYGGKIAVIKADNGGYKAMTYLHKWKDYYHPCFELYNGEYGRIICNERHILSEGNWEYELTTFNLLVCSADKLREKMFFVKKADKEFDDRKYLRYSMGK